MSDIKIDIIGYLQRNLKHPKQLDLTDEIINYIAKMDTELEKLKQEVENWKKASLPNTSGAICNSYTMIKWEEYCRLQKAADELATLKGCKGGDNDE